MKSKTVAIAASSVVAASILASTPTASAGVASLGSAQPAPAQVEIVQTAGGKNGGRWNRAHNGLSRQSGNFTHYYSGYGFPYLYEGCRWRNKRFFDGYRYYWKRVRVCY